MATSKTRTRLLAKISNHEVWKHDIIRICLTVVERRDLVASLLEGAYVQVDLMIFWI